MKIPKIILSLLIFNIALYALPDSTTTRAGSSLLSIRSIPDGVNVFVNGEMGGKTPLELKNLVSGPYYLRLETEGVQARYFNIFLNDDQHAEVCPIFDGDYGIVNFSCSENNAKVFIDDSLYGTAPLNGIKLSLGIHNIRIEKKDFDIYSKELIVGPEVISFNAVPDYSYGYLSVRDTEQNSSILLDGVNHKVSEIDKLTMLTGEHTLSYNCSRDEFVAGNDLTIGPRKHSMAIINHNVFTLKPFLYSFLVPGAGQFIDNSKFKGACLLGGAVLSGIFAYAMQSKYNSNKEEYEDRRISYLNAGNEVEAGYFRELMNSAESKTNDSRTLRNVSIGVLLGVYLVNWIDAMLNHSRTDEIRILDVNNSVSDVALQNIKLNFKIPFNTLN